MEIEGGMTVARDKSLPRVVAEAKLANVIAATGNDIMRELSKSTKEWIDAVSENVSGSVTGNQVAVVTPHVPKENV